MQLPRILNFFDQFYHTFLNSFCIYIKIIFPIDKSLLLHII